MVFLRKLNLPKLNILQATIQQTRRETAVKIDLLLFSLNYGIKVFNTLSHPQSYEMLVLFL